MIVSRRLLIAAILVSVTVGLTACSDGSPETIQKYANNDYESGLVYQADASGPSGVLRGKITIDGSTNTNAQTVDAVLPWTTTTGGTAGAHVKMTVQADSTEHGQVTCQIMYHDVIIYNEASGDGAKVVCEGTLDLKK